MPTDSCGRCGDSAPEALLRTIELRVDDSEVDAQTVCPDCFADWIAHYQAEMAGDMPGADGETVAGEAADGNDVDETVQAAREHAATGGSNGTGVDEVGTTTESTDGTGNNEIREVESAGSADAESTSDDVDVDLGSDPGKDEEADDEDDGGGLLLG